MAEKTGAGGRPQEYDEENGRYGKSSSTDYSEYKYPQHLIRASGREELKKKVPVIAYGFVNKERKNSASHIRHAKEIGFKNQDDYERAAVEFFNSDKGKLYFDRKKDKYYRYEEKTRKVAICDREGFIHTYFIARKGWLDTKKELENV